jgi:putative transposase
MLARLGIDHRCALKYHGQSKPIERFFRIVNDRFERRVPSYTGASIEDKPPYLLRNEPRARALHDDWVPKISDVTEMFCQWREEYADEPLPKRQGLTARQIFDEGKGAGLDPKALCFLMMACEIKTVRRNRLTFAGVDWEGPCLYGYKDRILIRYLLSDLSQIYVFDPRDQFMGIVTQASKADPIKDWQAAKRIIAERRSYKHLTKKRCDFIREKSFVIEGWKDPDFIEYIEAEDAKKQKVLPFRAFSDKPESSEAKIQSESEEGKIEIHPETGLSWWRNAPLPDSNSKRYEFYCEIAAKNPGALTTRDWAWIEDYEQSDEWKLYYTGKNPISKILQIKGAEDETKICLHQECQTIL